jgi:hypothetical protein
LSYRLMKGATLLTIRCNRAAQLHYVGARAWPACVKVALKHR